jgi:hypothetical protein
MSLINDALKQARQAPPRNSPNSPPPLQPARDESSPAAVWLVPAIIIFLVFAAIFFIGWAAAHRTVRTVASTPADPEATEPADTVVMPLAVSTPPPAPAAPVVSAPAVPKPKLQGIFYSPTDPSAILDGKTIHPGDQFKQYKVKEISKYTVTLIDADKKEITIGMGD